MNSHSVLHTALTLRDSKCAGGPGFSDSLGRQHVFEAMSYYSERVYSKISQQKSLTGRSLKEMRYKSPRVSPRGVTQDALHSCSNEWRQHLCDVVCRGSSFQRLSAHGALGVGAGHVDTLCLTHTKILDSLRERRCSA